MTSRLAESTPTTPSLIRSSPIALLLTVIVHRPIDFPRAGARELLSSCPDGPGRPARAAGDTGGSSLMAYQPPPPPQADYGSYGTPLQYAQPVYANWLYRVASYLIDSILVAAIVWVAIIIAGVIGPVDQSGNLNPLSAIIELVGGLGGLAVGIWNLFIRQGRTGQSLGKQAVGTRLVSESTGQPIGALM